VSLSNHGVLFLDELPEFKENVLEVMRQPLEDRVTISRAATSSPLARFMLLAAMNPCPCGYYSDPSKNVRVLFPRFIDTGQISGPLIGPDRHPYRTPGRRG
jgi:magnesium chelatase family protein